MIRWIRIRPGSPARPRSSSLSPPAWAGISPPGGNSSPNGGQGTYGETDDKVITNTAFILIAAFPLLVGLLSALQWRLEKRKKARQSAEKGRGARTEWAGGW